MKGPLDLTSQYWIGRGSSTGRSGHISVLKKEHFITLSENLNIKAGTKPFSIGLFTSTSTHNTYGIWQIYINQYATSDFLKKPWRIWSIKSEKGVRIREITSANDWVELVLSHPFESQGLLFPDWKCLAKKYDAIHMTLKAILAIQGIYFSSKKGFIARSYWDIESTLWFHWQFEKVKLVEVMY